MKLSASFRSFRKTLVTAFLLVLGIGSAELLARPDLAIDASSVMSSDLTVSPALPVVGKPFTVYVQLHNDGSSLATKIPIQVQVEDSNGDRLVAEGSEDIVGNLIPGGVSTYGIEFTASQTGVHKAVVVIDPSNDIAEEAEDNNTASITFPVIRGELFILYHRAKWRYQFMSARYMTNLTWDRSSTMGQEGWPAVKERRYWRRRGIKLDRQVSVSPGPKYGNCSLEDRVAYFELRARQSTEQMGGEFHPRQFVDELGNWGDPGWGGALGAERGQRCADSFIAFKERNPEAWMGVATSGLPRKQYSEALRKVDCVFPERYFLDKSQYDDGDWGFSEMTERGYADHVIMFLAIDARKHGIKTKGRPTPRWAPDAAEIENQIRSLRTAWPSMKGIAYYMTYAGPPYPLEHPEEDLILVADNLVYQYYVMPVLTLTYSPDRESIHINNIGAMDTHNVEVVVRRDGSTQEMVVPLITAGQFVVISSATGFEKATISSDDSYTILTGDLSAP